MTDMTAQIQRRIDELQADEQKVRVALGDFPEQRKAVQAFSDELFSHHEASLSPLRDLTYLPLSASSELALQELLEDFQRTGYVYEEIVEEQLADIRKEERKLEEELEDLLLKHRQHMALLEEEQENRKESLWSR